MLFDLFTSLTTRCLPFIRHLGYIDEAIAMRNRYKRRREAWQPHLEKTRRFVLSSAKRCADRNKVIVLGPGLLLDVPLAELASLFREVVLMDVVCLPQIRKRIKAYKNVTFIEHDATNIAEPLFKNKQNGIHDLPEARPASENYNNADLVVSLNILSQLWVVPRSYVIKPRPWVSEEQLDDWCTSIVEAHYASLLSLACPVCLVADYEFVKRDKDGKIFSRGSTVYDLSLADPDASWTWNIVPLGEESSFHAKELNVGAWHLQ